jgi:ABC-type polysaccharide/polyol phosphate export permease
MAFPPVIADAAVVAKRNIIKIKRVPDLLVFTTLSPIMFVLLFSYVFGGAIDTEGGGQAYREFLMTGPVVGWRIRSSVLDALAGFALLLVFAYAISWIMARIGMLVPSPEVVNNASFIVIFPLTFVANTFVPLDTLPAPLQTFAEWNPVPAVTQAARELFGNIPPGVPEPTAWPLQNPEVYTLIWSALFLVVFAPLAHAQYRVSTSR